MSSPTDYHAVLRRAVSALDPDTEEGRHRIYDRARRAITDADLPSPQSANERAALEAAIQRIETETQQSTARVQPLPPIRSAAPPRARDEAHQGGPQERPKILGLSPVMLAALATAVVLIVAVAGYAFWPRGVVADRGDPGGRADAPAARIEAETAADRTREPGRSYIFNRQLVYYRTIHPVGTIVIAKSQRFLYLVRPNVAALRYAIGVGRECANAVGLLPVSAKEEWPETPARTAGATQPPTTQAVQAGSRSRFGLRALALGDTGHRIHGTYAPTTAGDDGCFVLVNDDIVDLYERVPVGTRVVIN